MNVKFPAAIQGAPAAVAAVFLIMLFFSPGAAEAGAVDVDGQVSILNKDGQPLARFDHAVVFVEGITTPPPPEPALMDQKNKEFVPRLLPVVEGQEIRFLNSDKVQHNVFSPHAEEPFDLGLYPSGEFKSVRLYSLRRHKVYCNLHKSMVADILVLPSRYFSLTDEKGRYRIEGLPPGEYALKVWHIFGGVDQKPIRVGSEPLQVDFSIRSAQNAQDLVDHPDKSGRSYPSTGSESY